MTTASTRADAQARKVGGALVAQSRLTAGWLADASSATFARPTRLPDVDVRTLTAHLLYVCTQIVDTLSMPSNARPVSLAAHLRTRRHAASRIEAETRRAMGADTGADLVRQLHAATGDLAYALSDELPSTVEAYQEGVRTVDYLRVALLELVAHSDDLTLALPDEVPVPLDPQALVEVTRMLTELLGTAWPGRTLEVRVPPAAAVQIGTGDGGSTHTRGTPPNVVEMDPRTFVRLATQRLSWEDAIALRAVSRSGAHSDLGPMLPIVRLS